jgi:hypothetical protein
MERFRLKSATTAVHHLDAASKGVAVVIPAGSEVVSENPIDMRAGIDRSQFVSVRWARRVVEIFLADLIERGERINTSERELWALDGAK